MRGCFCWRWPLTSLLWQLSVRGKNKKEKLEDFFKNVVKSADGVLVAGVKVTNTKSSDLSLKLFLLQHAELMVFLSVLQDVDDFFEHEKTFLLEYHNRVKDASAKSDRMIRSHKSKNHVQSRCCSCLPRSHNHQVMLHYILEVFLIFWPPHVCRENKNIQLSVSCSWA